MNTAVRSYGQQYVGAQRTARAAVGGRLLPLLVMALLVLLSALGVVFTKDAYRRAFSQYQDAVHVAAQQDVQWNRLLLEEGAWAASSRIAALAKQQWQMHAPAPGKLRYVYLKNGVR